MAQEKRETYVPKLIRDNTVVVKGVNSLDFFSIEKRNVFILNNVSWFGGY